MSIKGSNNNIELEKKYFFPRKPKDLDTYPSKEISQKYLEISINNEKAYERRIRKMGDKCFVTSKYGEGEKRIEDENEISKAEFNTLWAGSDGPCIEKTRHFIPHNDNTIEFDVYGGHNEGLTIAEIEFDSGEEYNAFTPPEWFAECGATDVTNDERYYNKNLAVTHKVSTGLDVAMRSLNKLVMSCNKSVLVVAIAGGSASGKTSVVTEKLAEKLGGCSQIVSMDNYYRGRVFMEENPDLTFDEPVALNMDLLVEHITMLKAEKSIDMPEYNFAKGMPDGTKRINSQKFILVEGLFALDSKISDLTDYAIFVDTAMHGRVLRRLVRDVERTGDSREEILSNFIKVVEPMHKKYVQTSSLKANIVIKNEYDPQMEVERIDSAEFQIKFSGLIDPVLLEKLGARKVFETTQVDEYYIDSKGLLQTDSEVVRIRNEDGKYTFTYKGPQLAGDIRIRTKLEFGIDPKTAAEFGAQYGGVNKKIIKRRSTYSLGDVIFSNDTIYSNEEDCAATDNPIAEYTEMRLLENKITEKVNRVIKKIGLKDRECIKEPYFNLL